MTESSPTSLFVKRKSKPSGRTSLRRVSPEAHSNDTAGESRSHLVTPLKNKTKRAKPTSRLSFGGDSDEEGDGEVFKVKKSSLSQRLSLGTHPALPKNLEQASISPHRGPTYDKAYLNELKASTPTSRPSMSVDNSYDADISMDVDRLVSLSASLWRTQNYGPLESETFIPPESSVKEARERRERLRQDGVPAEDEFISLSVVKRSDEDHGPHPESRLVREEDELGEGDDEYAEYTSAQERIALGKKSRKLEASKRRDTMKEMIADAEEVDEETDEWEQEQLRRGALASIDSSPVQKVKETYKPAPMPVATPLPSLGPALTRFNQQLAQLTTSHVSNTAALTKVAQQHSEIDDREKEMRQMVERAETKRAWFGSLREWVEGVAGFLDEKYPLLEALEEEHVSLVRERFDMIRDRRAADDEDDLCTFLGISRPQAEEETDELGRVVPKLTPALRREARLARHRRRHPNRQNDDDEGYSTDSSLPPSDVQSYGSAMSSLMERVEQVLSDVRAEEFRDPGKGRWTAWREQYSDSYVGAWGGLGVVSVWEFWARLEFVGRDFIKEPESLDSFKWYQGLYEYSRPNGEELGSDGDLVASMISTAIIPRMCKLLEGGVLDVYSDAEVRRIVDLSEEVEASVEPANAKFLVLLKAVLTLFRTAMSENEGLVAKCRSVVPAGGAAVPFDPASIPARTRYLNRRMKLLRNLVKWKKYTGERFGIGETINRLVEGIVDIAEGGWDGGEMVKEQVCDYLQQPSPYSQRIGTVDCFKRVETKPITGAHLCKHWCCNGKCI
ncbi:nineteen complex-related protein 2-domain-containing protein [Mycena pura]|uniref:Nineteen complex-related protein 2-domain-containing protein n=1 Tax=Mycena pura TaxID=153505 RepID=A0AAD6UZA1_9AGAR|nr:nineteen complex-related protein 2-domain-containing protein [Mycena pura]